MNHPSTAREALIVETIGDVARLLDRVEALVPALDTSQQALADAGSGLVRQLEALKGEMATITQTARTEVVRHVVQRIDEAARRAGEAQVRVMADAARALLDHEVERALQRVLVETRSKARREPAWTPWLTHAATAAVAAAATWMLTVWWCGR